MKALTKIKVVLIIRLITPLQPPLTDLKKKTVFILRDSMVKKLNSFLLTRKPNRKCLVKVRSVNSAKVRCMHDHTKSTVRDFDPDYIILHCGTNDPNSHRKSSHRWRDYRSKSDKNNIPILLLTPRSDKLKNRASEVNNRLINMCSGPNIT